MMLTARLPRCRRHDERAAQDDTGPLFVGALVVVHDRPLMPGHRVLSCSRCNGEGRVRVSKSSFDALACAALSGGAA